MINGSRSDLVIITAPTHHHFSLAKECLQNGLHVVLEKPMTTTSSEALELIELAEMKGLVLSVFHNRRWDGDFLTVQNIIQSGALGKVHNFESRFDRFRPVVRQRWREQALPGAGIWFDLGAHLVDQALMLFGVPEAITARCLMQREKAETTDYFHAQLHYAECEVILNGSSFAPGPNHRFRVEGENGSFIKYGLDPQESQLRAGLLPGEPSFGVEKVNEYGRLYQDSGFSEIPTETGRNLSYYDLLVRALMEGATIPVSATEAATVLQILELGGRSSKMGKTLSFDKG